MDKKRSFVFYTDYREQLSLLDDAERGRLLLCLIDYADNGILPTELSGAGMMCFVFIRQRMDRDAEEYARICRVRAAAGAKGGRAKKGETETTEEKQSEAKKPNGSFEKQKNPDHDLDLDSDKDLKENTLKGVKEKRSAPVFPEESFEMQCVNSLVQSCLRQFPGAKVPTTEKDKAEWCVHIERMKRLDHRSESDIWEALQFAEKDPFWQPNIRSTKKFREKFEVLILQARNPRKMRAAEKPKNRFHNLEEHGYDYDKMVWDMVKKEDEGGVEDAGEN